MRVSNRELIALSGERKDDFGPLERTGRGQQSNRQAGHGSTPRLDERRGWSRSNLFPMRALAGPGNLPRTVVGRLPSGEVIVLLRLEDPDARK